MDYAENIGAIYLETSAKEDMNVQEIFTRLSKFSFLISHYGYSFNSILLLLFIFLLLILTLFMFSITVGYRLPAPAVPDNNVIKASTNAKNTKPQSKGCC